jgi:protein tyrosine phosphatase
MLKNYSKNKDEFSYSSTPRLPINTNDLSYDNYPKIIEQINKSQITFSINKTILKLKSDNEIYNEFKILKNFIDNDKIHYNNLIEENDIKNRYSDIRTYLYNTVPLSSNNYINASFINFPKKNFFIATQAPLNNTIEDFYQMIFDYDINIIVMLCSCYENGKLKCIEYYDSDLNEKLKKFYIEIIDEKKINNFNLKYREIKILDKINNKNKIIKNEKYIYFIYLNNKINNIIWNKEFIRF